MMNTGLIDCTKLGGIVQPKIVRSRRWSAYTATTVLCCWNSDQKTALATNIGMNETTRLRSSPVILVEVRITAKRAMVATTVMTTTIAESRVAVMTPATESTTTRSTTTSAAAP